MKRSILFFCILGVLFLGTTQADQVANRASHLSPEAKRELEAIRKGRQDAAMNQDVLLQAREISEQVLAIIPASMLGDIEAIHMANESIVVRDSNLALRLSEQSQDELLKNLQDRLATGQQFLDKLAERELLNSKQSLPAAPESTQSSNRSMPKNTNCQPGLVCH